MPSSKASIRRHRHQQLVWGRLRQDQSIGRVCSQHGPGVKHRRLIELNDWQRAILDQHPWRFLADYVRSNRSRHLNTIRHPKKTYRYPRYEFSNRSDGIRELFCEYCDQVGVEWSRMNRWNISVARRSSVALMDQFIGPKR